jgi:hypothetical protein
LEKYNKNIFLFGNCLSEKIGKGKEKFSRWKGIRGG